jgi:hypothetical protein
VPAPDRIHLNLRSLSRPRYNRSILFLLREKLSEPYSQHGAQLVQHLQRRLDLVVFDLGHETFRATRSVRDILQARASHQPRVPQARAYGVARKIQNLGAFACRLALVPAIAFCASRQLSAP